MSEARRPFPPALRGGVAVVGRRLRQAGVEVSPADLEQALCALSAVDTTNPGASRAALRCTLVSRREDLAVLDAILDGLAVPGVTSASSEPLGGDTAAAEGEPGSGVDTVLGATGAAATRGAGSLAELGISPRERRDAMLLSARLRRRPPLRRSHRRGAARTGGIDIRATVRAEIEDGGEPLRLQRRRRLCRPRRLVFAVDVSRSMLPHTRALLLWVWATARGPAPLEAFAFGTDVGRLTDELRHARPEAALAAAAGGIPDWAGGTQIAASLRTIQRRWPGALRGADVFVVSDGWESGDPADLGQTMADLRRRSHRVVWGNPLASHPSYRPESAGMRAALPHVAAVVPCLEVEDFEQMIRTI